MTRKGEKTMCFELLYKYLNEWFAAGLSTIVQDCGDNLTQISLLDNISGDTVFETSLKINDLNNYLNEIYLHEVSTSGIKSDELKGLIEQIIDLDKQISNNNINDKAIEKN